MKNSLIQKIQKIICYAFLIASVAVVISSFCYTPEGWSYLAIDGDASKELYNAGNFYMTLESKWSEALNIDKNLVLSPQSLATGDDLYSFVFPTIEAATDYYVQLFIDMNAANDILFYTGILGVISFAVCAILGGISRRKYRISNLVGTVITAAACIAFSIVSIVKSANLIGAIDKCQLDYEQFYKVCQITGTSYSEISSSNCIIGIIFPIVFIVVICLFVAFTAYKYVISKQTRVEAVSNE